MRGWGPTPPAGGLPPVLRGCGGQSRPASRRLGPIPAFWSKAEDAFAQAWDYPSAGPLWASPLFSRLDEVVTKASQEGSLMLVVGPDWGGPGYPWWAALCALCPRRWCSPECRPVYLRGGTELMPTPRWRNWAFLLDSRHPWCRARLQSRRQ